MGETNEVLNPYYSNTEAQPALDAYRDNEPVRDIQQKQNYHEISISPLNKGFILRVGCQRLAVTNRQMLMELLDIYYKNPDETVDKYYKGDFDKIWN